MKTTFINRCWRIARWLIALYLVLFLFRFAYTYVKDGGPTGRRSSYFDGLENLRKNYASEKRSFKEIQLQGESNAVPAGAQKYEKTAVVTSETSHFEQEDKEIRARTAAYKGIIQYEKAFGLKGSRELHMLIGISPVVFDSFYTEIRKIGSIQSMSVTKEDKTNEYRQLNAQKASLEKTLASLQELKSRNGAVGDFVSLHDKILEIEEKLQELGVELGNFNAENEFCTVKLSLFEGKPKKSFSFLYRVRVSFEWAIERFVYVMTGLFLTVAGSFIILLIVEKLKIMQLIRQE
jgi:uncharacterized protein YfcZ (UPF0381/DUF406 family)